MTLYQIKQLIRSSANDILTSYSISETELNMLVYSRLQQVAKLMNDYGHEFYKEKISFEQSYTGFGLVDKILYSAEVFIYKLSTAYIKADDILYPVTISTVDSVHQDTLYERETASIAFSNAAFYVHPPTAVTGDYSLYVTICSYPEMPLDDDAVVTIPPEYITYLVALCRKSLYERGNWTVPKNIYDEIALNEYKIINKA